MARFCVQLRRWGFLSSLRRYEKAVCYCGIIHIRLLSDIKQYMTTFRFITVGENLGTRKLGEETRNKLLPLLLGEGQVVLDLEGVNVVSNSFADECLAKLLLIMPLEELKKKTTFRGLNDFARKNISVAFKRRYLALNSEKRNEFTSEEQ